MVKFGHVRRSARKYWLSSTKRKRIINDITIDSLECAWQNKYVTPGMHNSFYCSMAEWNTHITDFLSDKNFDNFDFNTSRYNKALFRHYTRLLLLVSEIITDFQDFKSHISNTKQNAVRSELSIPGHSFSVDELFSYINNICKHKTGNKKFKYHCLNHHVKYIFKDSGKPYSTTTLNVGNLTTITPTGSEPVEIPKLKDVLEQLIFCYKCVDDFLEFNYSTINHKLTDYEK